MCVSDIKKYLCNALSCCEESASLSPPKYLEDVDSSEVYTILKAEFPNANILLSDSKYKTTTKVEYERYIKYDVTDKWKYVSQYYDCDDFSFSIMGRMSNPDWGALTFGIVWTQTSNGAHAVNCFIDHNREVWIVEPQNDNVFKLPSDWNPYLIIM